MYKEIFTKLYQSVDWMVQNYTQKDIERNHRNSGSASAYASVLRSMGHTVELRVYNADGYDLTNYIIIDEKKYDFFPYTIIKKSPRSYDSSEGFIIETKRLPR